jgi:Protein of unknown function (DUF1579)
MKSFILSAALALVTISTVQAQDVSFPAPQQEHVALKQFVGQWTTTSKAHEQPGQPAMECSGTISSRILGGFWVINELTGNMGGTTFTAIQTVGYDSDKKKYVGTWVDSMMNHLWHYEGEFDASGKKLILTAPGPNFMAGGKLTKFRDSYEFKTSDTIIMTAEMMGEDGKWLTFMTGEAKRKPANESAK